MQVKKKTRGLAAISQARDDRARGRTRWTAQAGLLAGAVVIGGYVAHEVVSSRELNGDRQALLAKQRAVITTLGPEWYPLRDKVEETIVAAARDYAGDVVQPEARTGDFRTQPGIYLRMRVADAKDAPSVRTVAADSQKDAFAACLLREPNDRGARGEIDGGAFSEQPWNLGRAYAATRILGDEWAQSVRDADDDLRMRVLSQQYDKAVKEEIPLAIDVIQRARFFLLVLDEDVAEAAPFADGGKITEEALELVDHPARITMVDLKTGQMTLRLRRSGSARVIPAGDRVVADPEMQDAMQRQANNCALARQVDSALATPAK